ncbi:MAG: methyltransferase domain-containing protein [Deltaproteobacteria bacterium]|nr:methyltransferase domain-containing protein [Deltaproteobacteria bacterium]MCW5801418.1 methyltransferase domain-containing protein [Deltaproteobacteria bacterium]
MTYEERVRVFYDSALHCYQAIMGDRWHHADPDALTVGLPRLRGCEVLEERIVALAGIAPGARALDFGSGVGGPTLHMARVAQATFVGVSNNDRLNELARAKARDVGMADQVSFVTLDDLGYKDLPFPAASFDAVTFFESVCHVPDKAALFRELARVLKPGGRLGGMDWIQRAYGEHQSDADVLRFMAPVNEAISIPWHGTVESYASMMRDAGLEVSIARDLYAGIRCWSVVQDDETPAWATYTGPEQQMFRRGEEALAAARRAGVFTIGMWIASKP